MKNFNLDAILEAMLKMSERVSDLNFSVGRPPQVEVDGQLVGVNFPGLTRLTPFQTEMIALRMLRGDHDLTRTLLKNGSVDLSYSIPQKTRFRVNIFSQRGTYAIVLRVIPEGVPTLEQLKMPRELYEVGKLKNGIVFIDTVSGNDIPSDQSAQNPSDFANVEIRGNPFVSGDFTGWIIVNGSLRINGDMKINGLVYAMNDLTYNGTGTGEIVGLAISQNIRDTNATAISSSDTTTTGNSRVKFNCNALQPPPDMNMGFTLVKGSYREVVDP